MDVDPFWELFFDREYSTAQAVEAIGLTSFRIVEQVETERKIFRKVIGTPKLDLPGPVARLVGSAFMFTEEGTFDCDAKVWVWKHTPSDKLESGGRVLAEPMGTGRVRLVSQFRIHAKMFGLEPLLESTLERHLPMGCDRSVVFMNASRAHQRS